MKRLFANAIVLVLLGGTVPTTCEAEQPCTGGDAPSSCADKPQGQGADATNANRRKGFNNFSDNAGCGLSIAGDGNTVSIARSIINNNGSVGVCVTGTNNKVSISGGEIRGNKVLGILVEGKNELNITGGLIEGNILVYGSSVVNIHGTNLKRSGTLVTGVLVDGTPINFRVAAMGGAKVVLHEATEEAIKATKQQRARHEL